MKGIFMTKKEYVSPKLQLDFFSCEDVLTASTNVQTGKFEDGNSYAMGSFNNDWLTNS